MTDFQQELSSELTSEDFLARFEQTRSEQNWLDMNQLFREMEAHQFHDLSREFRRELNDQELIALVAQTI